MSAAALISIPCWSVVEQVFNLLPQRLFGTNVLLRPVKVGTQNMLYDPMPKTVSRMVHCGSVFVALFFVVSPLKAQVAPTQVNQKMVDEFGVDRKTGRFAWSSGDFIKVGGDNRIGLSVDGDLKYSSSSWPSIVSNYDYNSNVWLRTVNYYADSQTFAGNSSYVTEYPVGSSLVNIPNGFLFTDRHGVQVSFQGPSTKITFPDGREKVYENGFISTNSGYMLKRANGLVQAVNQAVDYCSGTSSTPCAGLSQNRTASTFSSGGMFTITDALNRETKLRFNLVSAKQWRQTSVYNPPVEWVYYPLGVTLPGSTEEDITVTYKAINPSFDTHDDIWVTSVKKDGVTANYSNVKTPTGSQSQPTPSYGYLFTVNAYVGSQKIYSSFAVKSSSGFGQSRRTLVHIDDALVQRTYLNYNAAWEVRGVTLPSGRSEMNDYDARNNVIKSTLKAAGGAQPDLVTTYTYAASCTVATQATCNKPLSITDPNGNITEYTYNSRGQILTETKPAPTAGGHRPKVTNSYTLRTAYIKDVNGNPLAAGAPISLLTSSSYCQTLASCSGTQDEVRTDYDYGPVTGLNNLNLRGVGVTAANGQGQMVTNWTCYQYNYFGERVSETKPNAGIGSCP